VFKDGAKWDRNFELSIGVIGRDLELEYHCLESSLPLDDHCSANCLIHGKVPVLRQIRRDERF
jgi:hypothetical protein